MCTMILNNELNGVELSFDSKPEANILSLIKSNGFRWNGKKSVWYAKQSEKTLNFAKSMVDDNNDNVNNIETLTETKATIKESKTATSKAILPIWDRVQFEKGNADTSKYDYRFVGSNYTGLSVKDTAKEIRSHLKSRFPECKFSITSDYNSLNIDIKSSPYSNKHLEYNPDLSPRDYRKFEEENNKELNAILEYCNNLASSYNYDDSDIMTDYFNSHFYKHVSISYDYIQAEQTEAIKADILDYNNKSKAYEEQQEIEKELQYQEQLKQLEIEKIENEKAREQSKIEVETINNNAITKELSDNEQYFIIDAEFAHCNKNQSLEQYQEEVEAKQFYLDNIKIKRELHFSDEKAYNNFTKHLLTDFDFLENSGGSYTDDNRINSMTDYNNMDAEERKTVIFNLIGIAVYCNNDLMFVIDTQGFSYSRYVGLIGESTRTEKECITEQVITAEEVQALKEKAEILEDFSVETITELNIIDTWDNINWIDYKTAMKTKLKNNSFKLTKSIIQQLPEESELLKVAMYKLLVEVDGIQEQFKNADLKENEKLTLFYISDFGSMSEQRITYNSHKETSYAQYKNAIKLTFKPQGKRNLYYNHFYDGKEVIIYRGWIDLPKTVLHTIEERNGMTITSGIFSSCDTKQYDEILNHFEKEGLKPIINTYKPIF